MIRIAGKGSLVVLDCAGILSSIREYMTKINKYGRVLDCLTHFGEDLNSAREILFVLCQGNTDSLRSIRISWLKLKCLVEEFNSFLVHLPSAVTLIILLTGHFTCDAEVD